MTRSNTGQSPFLAAPQSEWVASNALAFALRDRYPVGPGHTLIVPHRAVAGSTRPRRSSMRCWPSSPR
jgi:uncharacterized membrane protein